MDPRAEELATKRLRNFARFCFVWALLLVARLLWLQIVEHETYRRLAIQQQQREVEIRAPRGAIFDRNGQPLAMSVAVDSVCINPLKIKNRAIAAQILSRVLHVDEKELLEKMAWAVDNGRGFLWVKRKATPEEASRLRSYKFEWVEFRTESTRYYPKGMLAAHVLGGVDHEENGNGGIELALNKELEGKPGVMRTTADVKQKVFERQIFTDPMPGKNVTLTIDERIQVDAERELCTAVKEHQAVTGSIIVMDPNTGDILALANCPTYDPNLTPKTREEFEARKNLAVTAPFEPGSVFKIITAATALETTHLTPDSQFYCHNGAFTLFRRVIHDAHPYGTLTMAEVIAKSSNIGAIKIALAVGNQKFHEYIRGFGFGSPTGIELPGESGGLVRKLERWIPSSIGSVAMGHEISTTSVQLARACSAVANGGKLVKPRLVLKRDGQEVPMTPPKQFLTPKHSATMRAMMRGVVDFGTGKQARLPGYSAGGKTGSAQIYDYAAKVYTHRYNGSFMGFAPAHKPSLVVVVTLNGTQSGSRGFGGVVAAPVFKKVMSAALRYWDVPRDLPDAEPPAAKPGIESDLAVADLSLPPEVEEQPVAPAPPPTLLAVSAPVTAVITGPKTPDFHGKSKRDVIAAAYASGVRVVTAGEGIARMQEPAPGTPLREGERVKVVFAR